MKIAVTAEILRNTFTGVEHYTYNLIKALAENKKLDLTLICERDEHANLFEKDIKRIIHKPFRFINTNFFSCLFNPPKCLGKFDVIHCPTVIAPFYFRPEAKVVMTVHDIIPILFPSYNILRRRVYFKYILKHRFKYVDKFIAVSLNTKRDLIEYFNIRPDKIAVVYEGVTDNFKATSVQRENFILTVGTLEPRKNFLRVIRSFINLKEKFNMDEELMIVGKPGWYFKDILKIPREYSHCIHFLGYVPQDKLIELYQTAKVFMYPSLYEGFGLPVLEAMACGCPVITSNGSSLPEVAGDAAVYVNPYQVDDIEKGLYRLLTDKDLRNEFSIRGLEQAQKFSWRRCAEETVKVYESLF